VKDRKVFYPGNVMNVALSAGAQVNAHDSFGDTALNLAAKYGHPVIVERLLEAGADIESLGGPAPH
jgi:ankyrin repeat protein